MTREINRRDFLKGATAMTAAAVGGVVAGAARASQSPSRAGAVGHAGLVDVNVWLSRWPFRRLPLDETPALVTKLRRWGVTQAWAGSFDGLLHKDLAGVNGRLAEECHKNGRGLLLPFGTINPVMPDWEEEMRRCHEEHKMPGIRLHPNYHGYGLADARFARVLDHAGERGLIVQLAVVMEDERTQHPLVRVPHVDVTPLLDLLKARPRLRMVLLNWNRGVNGALLSKLTKSSQVFFDIATVEGVGGVAKLCEQAGSDRLLFGSCAPIFYFESAVLKLKESTLSQSALSGIRGENARGSRAGR